MAVKGQRMLAFGHPPLAGEVAGRSSDGGVLPYRGGDTPPPLRGPPPLPGEDFRLKAGWRFVCF